MSQYKQKRYQYDYCVIEVPNPLHGLSFATNELQLKGFEGWELVQYELRPMPTEENEHRHFFTGMLKREFTDDHPDYQAGKVGEDEEFPDLDDIQLNKE